MKWSTLYKEKPNLMPIMNKKFLLALFSSPALFASVMSTVMITQPGHAAQSANPVTLTEDGRACIHSPHGNYPTPIVCIRRNKATTTVASVPTQNNPAVLQFSEEESNAAIALFSCDCPNCIRSLRLLRGGAPLPV